MEVKDEDLYNISSPFHTNLNHFLDSVTDRLQSAIDIKSRPILGEETLLIKNLLTEAQSTFNMVLGNMQAFLTCVSMDATHLNIEVEKLTDTCKRLEKEKDELNEKGHELHCRLGYNSLEKILEETLYSLDRHTSVQSAKCFRDEAEENVKRTNDLLRVAHLRCSKLDMDIFKEAEEIVRIFDDFAKERAEYVRELDLLDDVKRYRVSSWLNETNISVEEQEMGGDLLNFLNLSERQRHLSSEAIKSALRMDTFNATLTYDRKANGERMRNVTSYLEKINVSLGRNVILPRPAVAMTDLTSLTSSDIWGGNDDMDDASGDEDNPCSVETQPDLDLDLDLPASAHLHPPHRVQPPEGCVGYSLHRCPKKFHLATDPVTDPDSLASLELALRWDRNDGVTEDTRPLDKDSFHQELASSTMTKSCTSSDDLHDDEVTVVPEEFILEEGKTNKAHQDQAPGHECQMPLPSKMPYAFQHHVESSTVFPDAAENDMAALVMRENKDGRLTSTCSLTDIEKKSPERESRPESNQSAMRHTVNSGNKTL